MPRRRGKRAGVGAKATILSKYIQPKQNNVDKSHRSDIILESQFDDEKGKACYEFRFAVGNKIWLTSVTPIPDSFFP